VNKYYQNLLSLGLALFLGGCVVLDAVAKYKYIGIYYDRNKDEHLSAEAYDRKFDQFVAALAANTGCSTRELPGSTRMVSLVFPKGRRTNLDRVILSMDRGDEIGISIIKEAKGEDDEVIKLKQDIENAFQTVGLTKWKFYVQHSYGQFWNN
jgi:hypothetical protein